MSVNITVPQIGESVATVFISRWLRKPGEPVRKGDGVVEVDSDKASMEVPSPADGVLAEQLVAEGDEVPIGAVIGKLDEGEVPADNGQAAEAAPEPAQGAQQVEAEARRAVKAGPAARQAASTGGVDLQGVEGTGRRGRVTRQDVTRASEAPARAEAPAPVEAPARVSGDELVERVPMSPLRRTIARRLVEAQQTAAMLTTFNEVDMSAVMAMRKRYQERFVARYGMKLGFMSFFVKAAIEALKEFPAVNAEISGNDVLYKRFYHIGVAVSAPKGLVVPVLRDADRLSFAETEVGIAELAERARAGRLMPDDFQGGTFTLSNGGVFGSLLSTPILNPPQVGILGMHKIEERAVGVNGQVVLRPMMYLALSYDHRIIDGREAVGFLVRVKELVESPERILLEV